MPTVKIKLASGRIVEIDDRPIGQGLEKLVFFSEDRKEVVCFYHSVADYAVRRQRLHRVVNSYNPTTATNGQYWKAYYCWPTDIVEHDAGLQPFLTKHSLPSPVLGLTAPAYRSNFFFRDAKFGGALEKECRWFISPRLRQRVPHDEYGNLLTRMQICTRLARAVRRMHSAGLAHSDLSNKNVLIDPKSGDMTVIDIDTLVVPGIAPPAVLGTRGYIAPECLADVTGGTQPSVRTDKHSMAVLFYEILLNRHPLEGKKCHDKRDPTRDDHLMMGRNALFVEHPADRSNPPEQPIRVPFTSLGPFLADLFKRAFVDGLHSPQLRPDALEWERGFYRTLNLLHPATTKGDWTVVTPSARPTCLHTGKPLGTQVPYVHFHRNAAGRVVDERFGLVLFHDLHLQSWHAKVQTEPDETADRRSYGYVSFHQGKWILVNTSGHEMRVAGGSRIPDKAAIELRAGMELQFGPTADFRIGRVQLL